MKRKRKPNYLKTVILLLGVSVLLWNCEKAEILKVPLEKNRLETISITEAKELFEEFNNEKKNLLPKGSKEQFKFDPLWQTIKQEELTFSDAQLTNLYIQPKVKLNYTPKLFFIKINGYNIKAFETTLVEEVYNTGKIKKGFVYYHSIEGDFMTGFRVENGRIISRLKQKQKLNQAGFLSFFFQQCDGTEMNIGDLDGGVFDEVTIYGSLETMAQFMSGYNNSGTFHPSQMGEEGGSGNGFGGGGNEDIDDDLVNCPPGTVEDSNGDCVDKCETTVADLQQMFPNASSAKMQKLSAVINNYGKDFGIDTDEKLQHFLAQAGHETGGFNSLQVSENMNYSTASYIPKSYPSKFTMDTIKNPTLLYAGYYTNNPQVLANVAMCCKYGNGNIASGDGWKYRGRGIFQLTWKANYADFMNYYNSKFTPNLDFVNNPNLISTDETLAILSGLWFYKTKVLDKITVNSTTTVDEVTKKINGKAKKGIKDRKNKFNQALNYIICK